jgi:hypothetical protein
MTHSDIKVTARQSHTWSFKLFNAALLMPSLHESVLQIKWTIQATARLPLKAAILAR